MSDYIEFSRFTASGEKITFKISKAIGRGNTVVLDDLVAALNRVLDTDKGKDLIRPNVLGQIEYRIELASKDEATGEYDKTGVRGKFKTDADGNLVNGFGEPLAPGEQPIIEDLWLELSPSDVDLNIDEKGVSYFDQFGNIQPFGLERMFAHELSHYALGTQDPEHTYPVRDADQYADFLSDPEADVTGAAVQFADKVMKQIDGDASALLRTHYFNAPQGDSRMEDLKVHTYLADEDRIQRTKIGISNEVPNPADLNDVIRTDSVEDYSDLLIGLDGNDTLISGGGRDFLFGGEGDEIKIDAGDGNDVVVGGAGDDMIIGSKGEDYNYGDNYAGDNANLQKNEGEDTINFSAAEKALIVTYEEDAEKGVNKAIVSSQDDEYKSHLYSIEKVILSAFDDKVKIDDLDALYQKFGQEIDAGGNSTDGDGDVLDFSGLGKGVKLKRAPANGAVIEDSNVTIKNFENFILGDGNDVIDLNVTETVVVEAGGGNDVINIAGAASEIYLGAGSDILLHAARGSKIDLGSGGQTDNDIVVYSPGTVAIGADGYDQLLVMGVARAAGTAIRNAASESAYAYALGGMVKIGFNSDGEMVFGTILSKDGVSDDFMYIANGNKDPFAPSSELSFGIRVGEIEISAYQLRNLPDGISLANNRGMWEFMAITLKEFRSGEYVAGSDPLVFDLDGDGIELTAVATGVGPQFDIDGDGFSEYTGWVDRDDGLLAIDLNANGTIDDVSELFGNGSTSGFSELAQLDSNADGVIDANDAQFGELLMWRDLDRDGETDSGELFTLDDLGIASIDLTATDDGTQIALNNVARTSTFTYADGTIGTVGDIEFRVNNFDSTFLGDTTVDPTIAATMPNLRGHGTLTDLHVALTLEGANGQLAQTIQTVLPTLNVIDLDEIRTRAFDILDAWTKAPPAPVVALSNPDVPVLVTRVAGSTTVLDFAVEVTEDVLNDLGETVSMTFWRRASGASVKDASDVVIDYPTYDQVIAQISSAADTAWEVLTGAELTYMERFFGESIPVENPNSINSNAVGALSSALETAVRVMDQQALRLAIQGPLAPYFPGVEFDIDNEKFVATSNQELIPMFEAIFTAAPADASGATDWLNSWTPIINAMLADYDRPGAGMVSNPFLFTNIVAAYENIGLPITLKQAAMDLGIPENIMNFGSGARAGTDEGEMFYLTSGDDVITSGEGADVFVFGRDFGHDVIDDFEQSYDDFDVIRFAHLNSDEVTATRDGLDLVLTVNSNGDTIRVVQQFHEIIPGIGGGGNLLPSRGVEEIVFANGVVWALSDIALAVSHAKDTDDILTGTDHIDYLDGGLGNDVLNGGDNTDFYVFGIGYGQDRIEERHDDNFANTFDAVILGAGIEKEDLTFTRIGDSDDLTMTINGTTDRLDIFKQFEATYLSLSDNGKTWFSRIEAFVFEDGTSISWDDIAAQLLIDAGTDGDDTIYGFSREDTLDGGAGNDLLIGGNENDTYVFGQGYGHDQVHDQLDIIVSGDTDTVRVKPDLLLEDASFSRDGDSGTVVIDFASGEKLEVIGQFDATYTGPFGTRWFNRIEYFEFYNAAGEQVTIDYEQLMNLLLDQYQTDGNDTVYGFQRDETLQGGLGDDFLSGLEGNDTYLYDIGDGHDSIEDNASNILGGNFDIISLGAGIAVEDVTVLRNANEYDLVLDIGTHNGSITLINQVWYTSINYAPDLIDEIHFADGTIWNEQDLHRLYLEAARTDGDDDITGFYNANILDGGAGNDSLRGGDGNDTYIFARGYGHDTIYENVHIVIYDDDDKVIFQDLNLADLTLSRGDEIDDIVFTINDTGETLTIVDQGRDAQGATWWDIETFEFSDGTVMTVQEIYALLLGLEKTDGDDTINGFSYAETLSGGLGNDYLDGGRGNDTYHYDLGDGSDVIDEDYTSGAADRLIFGSGILADDVLVRVGTVSTRDVELVMTDGGVVTLDYQLSEVSEMGVEFIEFNDGTIWDRATLFERMLSFSFTDGDDTILGSNTADLIKGGLGNDTLNGQDGSDTYTYDLGDGNDTITERNSDGALDRLILGNGILAGEVSVSRPTNSLNDATLHFTDGGSITIEYQLNDAFESGIEEIEFVDGTIWTNADLKANIISNAQTSGDDTIYGYDDEDDRLEGGLGNDTLNGLDGNDTYVYNLGDGNDTILDTHSDGALDKIILGDGILPSEVVATRSANGGNDVTLTFVDGGSLLLSYEFSTNAESGIEEVHFADGTIWTQQTLKSLILSNGQTGGEDTIYGYDDEDDTIDGGAGNDFLDGLDGNDTYVYELGDGNDTIRERYADGAGDKLLLGPGILASEVTASQTSNDVTLHFSDGGSIFLDEQFSSSSEIGVEQIVFADGTIWVNSHLEALLNGGGGTTGTPGDDEIFGSNILDDVISGGLGNDLLDGLGGNDTYQYDLGDGNDVISDGTSAGSSDKLSLGSGILSSAVTASRSATNSDNVILQFADGGTIELVDQLSHNPQSGIEQIEFSDGTVWGKSDILDNLVTVSSTDGNDDIDGTEGVNDVLRGGLGDDHLDGLGGNDFYLYSLGDGADTIYDRHYDGTADRLLLGDGILTSEVTVSRSTSDLEDVTLTFIDGGSIKLDEQLSTNAQTGVEEIVFADGTIWTHETLRTMLIASSQTVGNDTITGFEGRDDTLQGGLGDDHLDGLGGNDTYIYNLGDGADTIYDRHYDGTADRLELGSGILASETTVTRSTSDIEDVTLTFIDGGSIKLDEQLSSNAQSGVESIVFADGTVWTHEDLKLMLIASGQTDSDDTITGFEARDDTLQGGLGDDYLDGLSGNDTYIYNLGDGADTIYDRHYDGTADRLELGSSILVSETTATRSTTDLDDVTLTFIDGGSVKLDEQFSNNAQTGIEEIVFADGTIWSNDELKQKVVDDQQTSAADLITGFTSHDDTFIFVGSDFGHDTVQDFEAGTSGGDMIEFDTNVFGAYADLLAAAADDGTDTTITVDADSSVVLKDVVIADLHQDDFRFV